MDESLVSIVHGFEGFWRDAIKPGCFPLFEIGNGTFDFVEGYWGVDGGEAWLLWDEFKDSVIKRYVIIEDFVEVHAED